MKLPPVRSRWLLLLGAGGLALLARSSSPEARRAAVVKAARSQIGRTDPEPYFAGTSDQPGYPGVSWCGLFALWALQRAGLAQEWRWDWSGRPGGFLYRLPRTEDPQPGDVAYIHEPYRHHAIVESVTPSQVVTIDGNSTGGAVVRRIRSRADFDGFFSVAPLLG